MYAKYTVHLKTLLEDETARVAIKDALNAYPLYETKSQNEMVLSLIPTREELNAKLLNAYKYREIGFETPGRFIDELKIAMCEIMPRYNQILKTVEIMNELENPFDNVDIVETFRETRDNTSSGENNAETTSKSDSTASSSNTTETAGSSENDTATLTEGKNVASDTPQDSLALSESEIDSVSYADRAQWDKNRVESTGFSSDENTATSDSTSSSENNAEATTKATTSATEQTITEHTFSKKGNQGVNTYAHDILEYRETLLNVPQMIINDQRIKELFMMVY